MGGQARDQERVAAVKPRSKEPDEDDGDDLPMSDVPQALLDAAGIESVEDDDAVPEYKPPVRTATGRKVVKH